MDEAQTSEEQKMSLIRKYPLETLVLLLCITVASLYGNQMKTDNKVDKLQGEMKTYLSDDRRLLLQSINNNTEVMNKNTQVLTDVADYLRIKETREALKD